MSKSESEYIRNYHIEEKVVKMHIYMETGEERLITFVIPITGCTLKEVLETVNVGFTKNTIVQCVQKDDCAVNFFVSVGITTPIEELIEKMYKRSEILKLDNEKINKKEIQNKNMFHIQVDQQLVPPCDSNSKLQEPSLKKIKTEVETEKQNIEVSKQYTLPIEMDPFYKTIVADVRRLENHQKELAKKLIRAVIFNAKSGCLSKNTKLTSLSNNADNPNVQPSEVYIRRKCYANVVTPENHILRQEQKLDVHNVNSNSNNLEHEIEIKIENN